ncbi:protein-L-isoaspartate O-methyltransferase family protein [Vannielia litorea]|uniref:protein-L-isoaspartate O-methyltransferase family protein n=1 Tax=Vannielia litorea TaxID=1217970 RepID=UPI001C949E4A|nr:protein-L-isoaspartate O-methyltransferase [Vannielia litorea]MBY6046392.1 protein-L-isoaspartate O-methyltransferase [Vannielia litorea]MBY6073805.1 protein-L-isoaspartate O-methyltransferase [Vannielia litorea]
MSVYDTRRTMMVDNQVRPSDVTKFPIIDAMLKIRREAYVPDEKREAAYMGENLELAPGRVMLEPRTFAKMLDALDIGPADMVLDLGCGLGYSAAVLAEMADTVVALEQDEHLASEAEAILAREEVMNAVVLTGPLAEGAAKHGPYDAIIVEGGVGVLPEAIEGQLKEGGRIACLMMEGTLGTVKIGSKQGGRIAWRFAFNASAPVLPGFEATREFAL